jgi:hypothetical protein
MADPPNVQHESDGGATFDGGWWDAPITGGGQEYHFNDGTKAHEPCCCPWPIEITFPDGIQVRVEAIRLEAEGPLR